MLVGLAPQLRQQRGGRRADDRGGRRGGVPACVRGGETMLLRAAVLLHLQSAACAAAVSFAAGVPTLATKTQHAGEYVFFPQTLRRVDFVPKDTLLISYQRDADALHDDGWKGGLLGSSGGAPWQAIPQPHSPMLVKS